MSVVTVYTECSEPYANYGLQHFMNKFGYVQTDSPGDADVYLGYSSPESGNFKLHIIANRTSENGLSYCNTGNENIPLFKTPVPTVGPVTVATVKHGQQEYPCISINNKDILVGFDIFSEIGKTLAGYYNNYYLQKDTLGMSLRLVPVVDVLEEVMFSAINRILPLQNLDNSGPWPEGHRFVLVSTHDVDRVYKTYQYLPSILKSIKNLNFSDLFYHLKNLLFKSGTGNPYWTFENIIKLEDLLGIKSTYYFLNETGKINPFSLSSWIYFAGRYNIEAPRIQECIQKLSDMEFEIGLHGSFKSYNNFILLSSEKNTLESIACKKLTGIRQHYLNYDNTTSDIHQKCGFLYDTTIGYKPDDGIGFKRGTSYPFHIMLPDMTISPLLEIPLIIMDSALGSTWTAEHCFQLIKQVEKYRGVLTILWHTNIFNKREYPGMQDLYVQIVNEARERGAWIARAADVYNWFSTSMLHTRSTSVVTV